MPAPAFTAAMALMLKYQRMRLTVSEVAAELGIAVNTIYNRRAHEGKKRDLSMITVFRPL